MLALILQIIDEEKAKKLNASISADGEKDEEAAE
jgi:hypothetical protein